MPIPKGSKRSYFPKVKEAREALADKAVELYEKALQIINDAQAKGDYEVALKGTLHLLDHIPRNDGVGVLDSSVDKGPGTGSLNSGPTIQIGIALGPAKEQKALPDSSVEIIDVTGEHDN